MVIYSTTSMRRLLYQAVLFIFNACITQKAVSEILYFSTAEKQLSLILWKKIMRGLQTQFTNSLYK